MIDVKREAEKLYEQTVNWRRDFHRHPELGYQEVRTAGIIADHLRKLGMEVTEHVAKTGVVGILRGEKPGPVVAVRADMDALPIQEKTGFSYASENPGIMHACGHDAHVAMLMATAQILAEHREQLKGVVKFIFQPAEEGGRGAYRMVEEGVLENPRPDVVLGAHMMFREAGIISLKKGYSHLASDSFVIRVHGHGGHGAKPQEATDTLLAACRIVTDLQMIVSRRISPLDTAVVTVGTIHSGTKENIIPDLATLSGTIRTQLPNIRQLVINELHRVCRGVCETFGTSYDLEYIEGCDPVYNDPRLVELVMRATKKALGEDAVVEEELGRSGSEDFSAYCAGGIPGVYIFVGGAYPGELQPSRNHQPFYNWDENALKAGVASEVASILEFLDSWY